MKYVIINYKSLERRVSIMERINFFDINEHTLKFYLNILNKTEGEFYEIQKLVNNYSNNLKIFKYYTEFFEKTIYEYRYLIYLKQLSTQNDISIKFFESGFKTLREMLTLKNSHLRKFLEKNDIVVNTDDNILLICGLEIYYSNIMNDLDPTYIKFDNKIVNIDQHRLNEILNTLNKKLNYNNGETEFFICGTDEEIYRYPHVKEYPEILVTLRNITYEIFHAIKKEKIVERQVKERLANCNNNLINNWKEEFKKTYLISAYADICTLDIPNRVSWMFDENICEILNLKFNDFFIGDIIIVNDYTLPIFCKLYLIYMIHTRFKYKDQDFIAVTDNTYICDIEFSECT